MENFQVKPNETKLGQYFIIIQKGYGKCLKYKIQLKLDCEKAFRDVRMRGCDKEEL
jgi:hypothetical protein